MDRWRSLLITLVALGACTAAPGDDTAADGDSAAALTRQERRALEAELVAADREFAQSVHRYGLGGWLERFAPAGRMVAGGESYIGQEGIRRAMLPVFADSTLEFRWDPTYAEIASSGDLGYTVGEYAMSSRAEGEPETTTGTYLTVWRRQPDGEWKVQADIGSPRLSN